MEREFPKLRALAKKERAVIFFSDESGVRSDFHAGTTWGIRGKTPVVAHTGKRFHLNMLSAISAKGELRFMTSRKRISAGLVFIDFLRRLITNYPRKIFLVVWMACRRNVPSRCGAVFSGRKRIASDHLFLPPYSPEINPDELVWNDVKNNGVGRALIRNARDLYRAVNSRIAASAEQSFDSGSRLLQMDTTRPRRRIVSNL